MTITQDAKPIQVTAAKDTRVTKGIVAVGLCAALLLGSRLWGPVAVSGQDSPSVRWSGRLIVAMNRRIEEGDEHGHERATLHEVSPGTPGSRPLLDGEIDGDYQLSPEATRIAFRRPEARRISVLDLTTRRVQPLSLPDLGSVPIQYGWCADGSAVWVHAGDTVYLASATQSRPATRIAKAAGPGYFGLDACSRDVAVIARDVDGRRVASALSVATQRPLRDIPPLSFAFPDDHICWPESFALEVSGEGRYAIGRRALGLDLPSDPARPLVPADGAAVGIEPLDLRLSAFMRPACLLGAVASDSIRILELRGHEVIERARYLDQRNVYEAISRTRDQPIWLGGPDRRVVAYVDPDCQRKVILQDLETRGTDSLWPGRAGDCGESVPLGWAPDRVVGLAWIP